MSAPEQTEPQADAILFTALLETVGLTPKEVAMFTLEPLEKAEQWKSSTRKMPHHIALSLIWLAKHIIEKQEKAEASNVILLLRTPTPALDVQKSKKLLKMVLNSVSWWASEHFEQAELYTKQRGGAFDLRRDTF